MKRKNNKFIEWVLYWAAVGMGAFVLFFLVTTTLIGQSVYSKCEFATGHYGGDCVEALIHIVQDVDMPYSTRNNGIWALGQLGDNRALPILQEMYTGNIPEREPYDDGISQYELKKAIKLLEGGFNASAIIWRR